MNNFGVDLKAIVLLENNFRVEFDSHQIGNFFYY